MRKRCRRNALGCSFFIFLLLQVFPGIAQQYLFDHFTTTAGLPSNMAYRCTRDAAGFIWIATSGGVARFDGQSFETFSEADGLPDNDIVNLYADRRNRVWFFGFNGRTSFYANGTMHSSATDPWLQPLQLEAFVMYVIEDVRRNMFLVYNNSTVGFISAGDSAAILPRKGNIFYGYNRLWLLPGAFEYTPGKVFQSIYGNDSMPVPCGLVLNSMQRVAFEPSPRGNLFYLKSGNVCMLSNTDFSKKLVFRSLVPVSRLRYLNDEYIAVMTPGNGVFFYSLRKEKLVQQLLDGETITDVFMNNNGDIWCTSLNNGLFYLPASRARTQYLTGSVLHNEKCTAVHVAGNGDLWVGMDNAQVQVFRKGKLVRTLSFLSGEGTFGRVNNIVALGDAGMCIATDVGLFFAGTNGTVRKTWMLLQAKKQMTLLSGIKSCSVTPGGDVLVAVSNFARRVANISARTGRPVASDFIALSDRILCAFEDSGGNTWLGTARGLLRIHGRDTALLYKRNPLLTKRVLQIGETRDGYIVLATDGAGLVVLKNEKVCLHITARNGLPGNSCRRMHIAGDTVYVATTSGIAIAGYDHAHGIFTRAVTEKDGLLSADCRDVDLYNGHLYAATDKGISILPLNDVFSPGLQPVTYLKKIMADGKPVAVVSEHVWLKYGVRSVTVNYGAVSQHATGGIEYRYRTAPGAAWVTTDAPSFVYNDPQPQDMEVTVQSRYKGGTWDKGTKLLITITPLFYQQAWFICLAIAVVLAAAGAAMIFYYRKQRLKLYNQHRLVKLESQASQAMMNPHFVFNSLNSVQHFLNENDNYAANQYLTRFSRLIRRHLELNRKQYITLEEEFDFLRLYLEVEKSRSDGRLLFSMQMQESIEPDELYIPVLILQPLVENAIWHGIHPRTDGGRIVITASVNTKSQLEIRIADDGVGFRQAAAEGSHESMGLGIIRDRLQLLEKLYGQEFSVQYANVTGGVTVVIHFPLLKEEDLLALF